MLGLRHKGKVFYLPIIVVLAFFIHVPVAGADDQILILKPGDLGLDKDFIVSLYEKLERVSYDNPPAIIKHDPTDFLVGTDSK